jgi:hypothetical protein
MSMILLEPAYKILHTSLKFKRRTISVTPFPRHIIDWLIDMHCSNQLPVRLPVARQSAGIAKV